MTWWKCECFEPFFCIGVELLMSQEGYGVWFVVLGTVRLRKVSAELIRWRTRDLSGSSKQAAMRLMA